MDTTEEFLNRYAFSDFYDYFQLVENDYEDKRSTVEIDTEKGDKLRTTTTSFL